MSAQTGVTTMEISVEIAQKAVNSAIPSLGIDPKVSISYYRDICSSMLVADLFIIDNKWKQCRYSSHSELIIEMWRAYRMECYLTPQDEIIAFSGKWVELEIITLL